MTHRLPQLAPTDAARGRCWATIGVWGDRSCPELWHAKHCHHCQVFSEVAREFLDRPQPDGYGEECLSALHARANQDAAEESLSVVVFDLGKDALCVETRYVLEALTPRPVRRVPKRSSLVFGGLVNVRGQLELFASLRGLLGCEPADAETRASARMLMLCAGETRWVVEVDRIQDVRALSRSCFGEAPSIPLSGGAQHVRQVLRDDGRTLGYLDVPGLFDMLDRCAQ